ncbi:hypothetical protein [Rhodococcus sp. IEGM 1379]|uniref:hypothetical protein n=1 Tax=Rhodococcus sp. IEGM 1379 TaxID=3047086 RepID=UPI0024B64B37|nr:hypothetical protein [Rhodococcus sp. IEGM 1379]MDI9915642.1 hypothetical protein [Rhodococcus sp. IEGM 1379]
MTSTTTIAIGDRFASPLHPISDLLGPSVAGSSVLEQVCATGLVAAGLLTTPVTFGAERTKLQWTRIAAVTGLDTVGAETVITRVSARDSAIEVDRHIRLLDDAGNTREEGIETWTVPVTAAIEDSPGTDFCTVRWGQALCESLSKDQTFAASLANWDGTIGLRCTDGSGQVREVHLRIYRGRIVDVTRRVPNGATFTFAATAVRWVDLVMAERNDFMRRAIAGEFSSSGDGYEYLRLTKPLGTIIEHARIIAKETHA